MNSPDPSNDDMADETGDGEEKKSEEDVNPDEGKQVVLDYQDLPDKKETADNAEEKINDYANYNIDDLNADENDANDNKNATKKDDDEENENDYNGEEYEGNDDSEEDDYEFEEEGEGAGHTSSGMSSPEREIKIKKSYSPVPKIESDELNFRPKRKRGRPPKGSYDEEFLPLQPLIEMKTEDNISGNVEIKLEPPSSSDEDDEEDPTADQDLEEVRKREQQAADSVRFRNALKNVKNEVPADSDDEWGNDSKFVKESDDEDPDFKPNVKKLNKKMKMTVKKQELDDTEIKEEEGVVPKKRKRGRPEGSTRAKGDEKRANLPPSQKDHCCTYPGCLYVAARKQSLKKHVEAKHLGMKHPCDVCEFQGSSIDSLRKHKKYNHSGEEFKCETCNYKTKYKRALEHHVEVKHKGKVLQCEYCEYTTSWAQNLKAHISSKHLGIRHACNQCDYSGPSEAALRLHVQVHHTDTIFHCDQCDYSSKQKSVLRFHIKSKHIGKSIRCQLCDYTTVFKCNLRTHIESKHMGIKHKCDKCEHESPTVDSLNKHKESQHSNQMFYCTDCSFSTHSMSNLRRHFRETHQEKKLKCEECNYVTSRRKYLRMHWEKEHEPEEFTCQYCNKVLIHSISLRNHLRKAHPELFPGIKPKVKVEVRCKVCDKLYNSKFNLKRHMKNVHAMPYVPDVKPSYNRPQGPGVSFKPDPKMPSQPPPEEQPPPVAAEAVTQPPVTPSATSFKQDINTSFKSDHNTSFKQDNDSSFKQDNNASFKQGNNTSFKPDNLPFKQDPSVPFKADPSSSYNRPASGQGHNTSFEDQPPTDLSMPLSKLKENVGNAASLAEYLHGVSAPQHHQQLMEGIRDIPRGGLVDRGLNDRGGLMDRSDRGLMERGLMDRNLSDRGHMDRGLGDSRLYDRNLVDRGGHGIGQVDHRDFSRGVNHDAAYRDFQRGLVGANFGVAGGDIPGHNMHRNPHDGHPFRGGGEDLRESFRESLAREGGQGGFGGGVPPGIHHPSPGVIQHAATAAALMARISSHFEAEKAN